MATMSGCGAADEGNLDDGFYYINLSDGMWVVEQLPKNPKNVKSITVVKDDVTHTITSLDMGDYALLCHEEKRTCRELRPQMLTPIE